MGNMVLDAVRLDDIKHDPWGTAMQYWFDIADILWAENEQIPAEWAYRPGLGWFENGDPNLIADMWTAGYVNADDLIYAGSVLGRYAAWCAEAGKDY